MNPRTRVLLGILIGVAVLGLGYKTVFPSWIAPLFNYEERIAAASDELNRLAAELDKHDQARAKLKEFVSRSGGTDAKDVKNDLQARVNLLIDNHNLVSKGVAPSAARENRKSLLNELGVTVNAEGTLESVVKFLVACEELPQLVRIEEVDLRPLSSSGRNKKDDRVTLNCRLAAVVPPAKVVSKSSIEGDLNQPETFVRHEGDAERYALIWERKPFSEYEPPKPVQVVEREPKKPTPRKTEPVERKPQPPKRDSEAQVDMVAIFGDPGRMVYEVHVSGGRQPEHRDARLSLGDKMDEGKIVLVHPLGVVVSKEDGEFLYPVGQKFKDNQLLADASEYPQIQAMVDHLRARTVAHVEPAPADETAEPVEVEGEPQADASASPPEEAATAAPDDSEAVDADKSTRRVRPAPRTLIKSPRNRPTFPVTPLTSAMKEQAIPPAEIVDKEKTEESEKPAEESSEEKKEPATESETEKNESDDEKDKKEGAE